MNPESIFEILELAHSQKRIVRLTLKSQRQLSVVLNGGLLLRPDGSNATSAFVAYGSSSKPPSLNDGGADLFKRVTFDQVLKSVESSRER